MTEDCGQRSQINTRLRESGGEGMPEVIEHEVERSAAFLFVLLDGSIVSPVEALNVLSRFRRGREYPW